MKLRLYFIAFIFFVCIACDKNRNGKHVISEAEKTIAKKTMQVPADYSRIEICYAAIINGIKNKNDMVIDQLISENGLFMISSLDDKCMVKKYFHINQFIYNGKTIFDNEHRLLFPKLKKGTLPMLDCRLKNHYNKNGSFGSDTDRLRISNILKYCESNDSLNKEIKNAAERIGYTIIHTQLGVFYFSSENNQWRLIFLDIRNPCDE